MPIGLEEIPSLLQLGGGLLQGIFGGGARRKSQKELETMADNYKPNEGILDYYNKALARYSANPYQSTGYQNQSNQIQRNLATSISSGQDRRQGLMGTAMAVQQANDAGARAAAQAEQQQGAALGQLGQAAGVKSAEDRRKFDMKYNLLAMKAGNSASTENQGYRNIFGGLSNLSTILGGKEKKDKVGTGTTTDETYAV